MSSNISRRSFLKGTVAGVAGLAASRLVGTPVQQAAAEASAEPQFASAQQASSALLNPQSCAIFRYDDAPVMKDTKLFTPWQFGGLTIGNRLVKSAAGSAYLPTETPENIINEYTNWAKGGVKLVWIEDFINTLPDFPAVYKIYGRENSYLRELVDAIHAQGSVCGYQLSLMGASFSGFQSKGPGDFECAHADDMTYEELINLEQNFIDAAKWLKEQGVDAVEINAAGNNIGQAFLSRNRNARTDEYGPQSFENRTRFLCDIIRGIKEVNGKDFPVQILINAIEENDENIGQNTQLTTVEENVQIAKMLEANGVDALHLRCGPFGKHVAEFAQDLYFTGYGIAGTTGFGTQFDFSRHFQGKLNYENSGAGILLNVVREIKSAVSIPCGCVGFVDPARAPKYFVDSMENGDADFFLLTRPLIADPEYVNKLMENRFDEIRPCNRCMHCHFDYDEEGNFYEHCRVNATHMRAYHPDVMPEGREVLPAETVKKVMVIGAGPAGMEAAAVAAKRGHKVTLVEKNGYLGGLLLFANAIKGPHENLENLNTYLKKQLELNGVEVITGQAADAAYVKAAAPDAVILATGGVRPEIGFASTSGTRVMSIDDVARGVEGSEIVILGSNAQAVDVVMYLQAQGKHVTVVTEDAADKLGKGQSSWVRTFTNPMIYARGTRVWQHAKLLSVGEGTVTFSGETGVDMTIKADTVIDARDMLANTALLAELEGIETVAVGDCNKPFNIAEAIASGNIAARNI